MYKAVKRAVATAICIAVVVTGCKSASGAASSTTPSANGVTAAQSLAFTRLHNSFNSGFTRLSEFVIQDADEFTRRWRGVLQGAPDAQMPVVDFGKTTVVFVAIGSRNTGGYSVQVDSVTTASGSATVHYTVTSPRARCMSMQMLTSPIEVISLARLEGVVRFRRRNVPGEC